MTKKALLSILMVVALIPLVSRSGAAQEEAPRPAVRDHGPAPPSAPVMAVPFSPLSTASAPPSWCKPCLWYAGDFDVNNKNANGVANEKTLAVSQAAVYVPFTVPQGKTWSITGVFGNMLAAYDVIDPPQADWSFSKGVSDGNGGTVIKSGTSPATIELFGQGNIPEYQVMVKVKKPMVTLKAGEYWLTVVPYCTNSNDSYCSGAYYYLADVEDDPPPNHYGPKNVLDASYFTSSYFGYYYVPTWGSSGVCGGTGCDMFSVGLLGTAKADDGARAMVLR